MLWYGMSGPVLKQIKSDILKKKFSQTYICEKYNINDKQFDLICKWKLKIGYKLIDERITKLEKDVEKIKEFGVGSQVFSKDIEFGVGTVTEMFTQEFDFISFNAKFPTRKYSTQCKIDKHGKMTTSPDGTVVVLKRLS